MLRFIIVYVCQAREDFACDLNQPHCWYTWSLKEQIAARCLGCDGFLRVKAPDQLPFKWAVTLSNQHNWWPILSLFRWWWHDALWAPYFPPLLDTCPPPPLLVFSSGEAAAPLYVTQIYSHFGDIWLCLHRHLSSQRSSSFRMLFYTIFTH